MSKEFKLTLLKGGEKINKSSKESENQNQLNWREFLKYVDGPNSKLKFSDPVFQTLKEMYDEEVERNGYVNEKFAEKVERLRKGDI